MAWKEIVEVLLGGLWNHEPCPEFAVKWGTYDKDEAPPLIAPLKKDPGRKNDTTKGAPVSITVELSLWKLMVEEGIDFELVFLTPKSTD